MSLSSRAPQMTLAQQRALLANDIAETLNKPDEYPNIAGADGSITSEAIEICLNEFLENASRIQYQMNQMATRNADKPVASVTVETYHASMEIACHADDCHTTFRGRTCPKCGQVHAIYAAVAG